MRILLVEDEPDLGRAIQRTLTQSAYVVDWAQDGLEAWNYLEDRTIQYTLGIFDWLLPGLSGLELCKRLRAGQSSLPILILTAKDQPQDIAEGLDSGADDYLVKPFLKVELLARLRALQRRSPQYHAPQLQSGCLVLDLGTFTLSCSALPHQNVVLTRKEFHLMEYFMQHPGQIVTRNQILNQLWEFDAEPVSNVVAALIRQLRRKLSVHGWDHQLETLYGIGYRFNPQ